MTEAWGLDVSRTEEGERVDRFLADRLEISRGYARRLLARGGVSVNDARAVKGARLRPGDIVRGPAFRHPSEGPAPDPSLEVRVVREEGGLLAVDKPSGVPTHPLDYDERGTVVNALLARHPEMAGVGEGGLCAGMVHRLDVGTSGVLLFATRHDDWRRARRAFEERRVLKRYLARVEGGPVPEREVALRLEHRGPRMRVVERGGREAVTRLRPLRSVGGTWLVEAEPVTGVMHQIRVTLSHLGHPVVGDPVYGSRRHPGRLLLHATEIRLENFEARVSAPAEITEARDRSA